MGDRSFASLEVVGWPGDLIVSEGRAQRSGPGGKVVHEWQSSRLNLDPCFDDASYGGTEEWAELARELRELDMETTEFEPYEAPPAAFKGWGSLTLSDPEMSGGSYTLRDESEVPKLLRALGLAYVIRGDAYYSEWDADWCAWRPGWAEQAGGIASASGEVVLTEYEAARLVAAAGDLAQLAAAIKAHYALPEAARSWRPWREVPDAAEAAWEDKTRRANL